MDVDRFHGVAPRGDERSSCYLERSDEARLSGDVVAPEPTFFLRRNDTGARSK
jgi:hypothetical protein